MVVLMRTVWLLLCVVLVTLAFRSIIDQQSQRCERGSRVRKSSLSIIASHTTGPMWPDMEPSSRQQTVNWVPHGPRQNHRVSDESRHLDARHAWPTGVWICPDVCISKLQLWVNSWPDEGHSLDWQLIQEKIHSDIKIRVDLSRQPRKGNHFRGWKP